MIYPDFRTLCCVKTSETGQFWSKYAVGWLTNALLERSLLLQSTYVPLQFTHEKLSQKHEFTQFASCCLLQATQAKPYARARIKTPAGQPTLHSWPTVKMGKSAVE